MQTFDDIPKEKPLTPLLDTIDTPQDLRTLSTNDLPLIADQLRAFMIHTVGNAGGHFASGLGVVELTIALHYIFDTPKDTLVWDVGHQAYPHKILTARKNQIHTIRQFGGLAPFTEPSESVFDSTVAGHASTSISNAIGMRIAADSQQQAKHIVAIVGDGALTGGMSFEALNHAGTLQKDLLVILNDNAMSISSNVGALAKHCSAFFASTPYQQLRDTQRKIKLPSLLDKHYRQLTQKSEQQLKGLLLPDNIFQQLGFQYFGPVDGHDIVFLLTILRNLKKVKGPILLHVITKKGKGFLPAEENPIGFHAIAQPQSANSKPTVTYANLFGKWIVEKATHEPLLQAITPAMCEGSDLLAFRAAYPNRYHDVGIAEQHALTLAAGMALGGLHPVVAIYSTFLQRAYDQFIHDVCLQKLPILLAVDRAGLVGGDGATHHGNFDISYLRIIPNCVIMAASSGSELIAMLEAGFRYPGVAVVRYPRGAIPTPLTSSVKELCASNTLEIGVAEVKQRRQPPTDRKHGALLSFGAVLEVAQQLADNCQLSLINMRTIKPLDHALLTQLAQNHHYFITIEEHVTAGGAGSSVLEWCAQFGVTLPVCMLGLGDTFYPHGAPHEIKRGVLDYPSCEQALRVWYHTTFNEQYPLTAIDDSS